MSAFNVYNDVYRELFSSVLDNLSLCNRKHESDQDPEPAQAKLFPKGEALRKRFSGTTPINRTHTRERLSV